MNRYAVTGAIALSYGAAVFGISHLIRVELGLPAQIAFNVPVLIGGWFIGQFIARKVLRP